MIFIRKSTVAIWQLLICLVPCPQLTISVQNSDDISLNETVLNSDAFSYEEAPKCEPLRISFCDQIGYNLTKLPNSLGHATQADIESEINVYEPLVKSGCSPELKRFLCSFYAPMCVELQHGSELKLQPCQSLCETARRGCAHHIRKINIDWPAAFACEKFPDGRREKDVICVGNDSHSFQDKSYLSDTRDPPPRDLGFVCPKNFEVPSYSLHFDGRKYHNCAMPCEEVHLDKDGHRITRFFVGIFATICIISTVFTCTTYLIDTRRFEYPTRPMIIIAFCQLAVALCYLVGFITHNKVACNDPVEPPPTLPNMKMIRSTTMGNKKGSCTLLFMTLYFFQMSGTFWWLMMTISWFMIAKLKWAPEAVSSVSRYFHFTTWTVPALFTLYLAVLGDIEGDSLSGACFMRTSCEGCTTYAFLLAPMGICLILGSIFLILGCKSIWDSRDILKLKFGSQTDEHLKLVIRIVLYSILYILFTAIFMCMHYHEAKHETTWKKAWLSNVCKNREYSIPCPTRNYASLGPHYLIFILKYASSMAIGMISSSFVLSTKTVKAYHEVTAMYQRKLGTNQ